MVNPATVRQTKPTLNDMVYCNNCGAAMVNNGKLYHCPNSSADSGLSCTTKPVYADQLLYAVVRQLINRLATEDTIQNITETIQETAAANDQIQRTRMEQAEAAIVDAKSKKTAFLQLVEHGTKTYQDVAADIAALDSAVAGLAYESIVARNELEKIAFVSDVQDIRETTTSMDTWLGGNNLDEAQELLELMVQKVMVNSRSALVVYHEPMPTDDHPESITEDLVPLYPSINA